MLFSMDLTALIVFLVLAGGALAFWYYKIRQPGPETPEVEIPTMPEPNEPNYQDGGIFARYSDALKFTQEGPNPEATANLGPVELKASAVESGVRLVLERPAGAYAYEYHVFLSIDGGSQWESADFFLDNQPPHVATTHIPLNFPEILIRIQKAG